MDRFHPLPAFQFHDAVRNFLMAVLDNAKSLL
jgi:hypothetical protein